MTHPLRLARGPVDLSALSTEETHDFDGGKSEGTDELAELGPELAELQEMLFAEGRSGGTRSVLLILQGMDTSGKGGTIRHAVGLVDPQGVSITAFGAPTPEELEHDFLWRIEKALPEPGRIGVFDRSHYEDVLVARVRELATADEIERRYDAINEFEKRVVESGTTILKCLLHISADEQADRLAKRLDRPEKHWKFHPGDIDDRLLWPAFQEAYEIALERTNTEHAPWHVVPADRKWYRNLAVARLLHDTLADLDLAWPEADFDVAEQQRRLREEDPLRS